MKKIYMILAAIALLTLSLNAQMTAKKKVVAQPSTSTEKVDMPLEGPKMVSHPAIINSANRAPSRATEIATLNLFDTTYYVAQVLPIYGYWHDASQHNQMIYPASMLTDMVGKKIKAMVFFPAEYDSYSGINFYNGSVTFKLTEVTGSTGFNSSSPSYITGTMTTVKTVSMPSSANTSATTWEIEFDQDYEYNGGDLVIDVTNTTGGYGRTYFYIGTTENLGVANPGLLQYSSNSAQAIDYVPQVTFFYEIETEPEHDLAIALSAPSQVGTGNTVTVTATVTNNGEFDEQGYTVTFTANGNTISTQTASESLPIGGTATFTAEYTTTDSQGGQTVNFAANVACTDDIDASNNSATASTSVITMPPPENVVATPGDNQSATVTWDAPSNLPSTQETYSWDFESESQANEWTFVNADGDSYNWQYHIYVEGESADIFEPHSGTGYMSSASFVNNVGALTPDNWMISPEVTLGGTLTLWAKGTDTNDYAENFGIFVYSGSYISGTSGFVQVDTDVTTTGGWVQYTFNLSQYSGQGRIAIRHYNCTNMYNLEIDDVNYELTVPIEPVSYNIYLDGELVGNVNSDVFSYTFSNVSTGEHQCAVSAVYEGGIESAAVPATFGTLPPTDAPTITYEVVDNGVIITATGNGTVTLSANAEVATGEGSASIFVPSLMEDYTVNAIATAQESGKAVSEPTELEVPIPGLSGGGWRLMDGSYTTDQALNFIDDETNQPIIFEDIFSVSTQNNEHPDHYDYILREDGQEHTSSTVPIPVHKTYSTMQGLYTKTEVDNDTLMALTADAMNSKMVFDIKTANEMYYYGLTRGDLNADYPPSEPANTISQIMLSHETFSEQLNNDVFPRYQDIQPGIVERLDREYVIGEKDDYLSYVPVIWTKGYLTNRRVGDYNTYGSDIKRETLGGVSAVITGTKSDYSSWGKWKVGETEYCVYTPTIEITGIPPVNITDNDGDLRTYVPYMYRAWCTYNGARDFANDADGKLIDNGPLAVPYLLGTNCIDETSTIIGGEWEHGDPRLQWAFGVPVTEDGSNVTIVVRFYYKQVVTDNQSGRSFTLGDGENEEYYVVEVTGDAHGIVTGINSLFEDTNVVSVTYVNAQGMKSDKPFDGLNIVVTRYSDGTTKTVKVLH